MKKDILCTSPPFHTQIFDSAYDPQPLKASVGLLHTTDLCSQSSRLISHGGDRKQMRVRGNK